VNYNNIKKLPKNHRPKSMLIKLTTTGKFSYTHWQ